MKVLVTGAAGQLGQDVIEELSSRGHIAIGTDLSGADIDCDITDYEEVCNCVSSVDPDAVIHCAAWTNVDGAEEESNRHIVYNINASGTLNLVNACKTKNIKFLYTSTDYVFSGDGNDPWKTNYHNYKPINVYGDSKLKGEQAVSKLLEKFFIVRIQWVYGTGGKNFIKTMLNIGKKYESVRVVSDQIGTPTYTKDIARAFAYIIESDKYGYYHVRNEGGFISWYDLTCKLFSKVGYTTEVIPVTTEEYGVSKAKRPFNSRLDTQSMSDAGFELLPDWEDALDRYLEELRLKELL